MVGSADKNEGQVNQLKQKDKVDERIVLGSDADIDKKGHKHSPPQKYSDITPLSLFHPSQPPLRSLPYAPRIDELDAKDHAQDEPGEQHSHGAEELGQRWGGGRVGDDVVVGGDHEDYHETCADGKYQRLVHCISYLLCPRWLRFALLLICIIVIFIIFILGSSTGLVQY